MDPKGRLGGDVVKCLVERHGGNTERAWSNDMREMKELMRLLVAGVERLLQAPCRSKASEDDLAE